MGAFVWILWISRPTPQPGMAMCCGATKVLLIVGLLARSGHRRGNGVFAWVGLAALLVGLCMWPWVKPEIDAGVRFARGAALSPKSPEVTVTPVTSPADVNPKPVPTKAAGDRSNQSNESVPGTAPDAAPAPADFEDPGEVNPPAPALRLASQETPKRPGSPARELGTLDDSRYVPGGGRLVVESSVSGAHISIDGESNPKWVTPRAFHLAPGTYIVSVSRPGYDSWTKRIRVDEGREYYVSAELSDHDGGIFTVDTEPAGMAVFIDGKAYGPSRVETVLSPGWHVCSVVPGPGLQAIVSRFHLDPGQAVTRKVRMSTPAGSSKHDATRSGKRNNNFGSSPQGGFR